MGQPWEGRTKEVSLSLPAWRPGAQAVEEGVEGEGMVGSLREAGSGDPAPNCPDKGFQIIHLCSFPRPLPS